jgi:hypothetical protein
MRRRRPLLRGAMLAGAGAVAYHAGRQREARDEQEADQDQQLSGTSESEAPPASDEPASGGGTVDQLERLKQLLDEGALSQAEYQSAKQQVLGGR